MEAVVQAKGQVTIPKQVRDEKGIKPGDRVSWVRNEKGEWVLTTFAELVREFEAHADHFDAYLRRTKKGFRPRGLKG